MRLWDTPVPIPNTMVKTQAADGTLLETARESRWMPALWGYSSVGRAPALQAGGHEFESRYLHESFFESADNGRHDTQACLNVSGRSIDGIFKMPVNEKIKDFRVLRKLRKSFAISCTLKTAY